MLKTLRRRAAILTLALPLAVALSGCSDDSTGPDDHDEFPDQLRLTIGSQVVTVANDGAAVPNPVFLTTGSHQVSAVFLDDEGVVMDLLDDEYRLEITSDDTGVLSYQSSGAFTGTLTASSAGNTAIRPQLLHIEEGHPDFGPFAIAVTVQ